MRNSALLSLILSTLLLAFPSFSYLHGQEAPFATSRNALVDNGLVSMSQSFEYARQAVMDELELFCGDWRESRMGMRDFNADFVLTSYDRKKLAKRYKTKSESLWRQARLEEAREKFREARLLDLGETEHKEILKKYDLVDQTASESAVQEGRARVYWLIFAGSAIALTLVVFFVARSFSRRRMESDLPELKNPAHEVGEKKSAVENEPGVPQAGELKTLTLNGVDYRFHYCPAGSFMMGSPKSEKGHTSDEVQHKVKLTKGFYVAETPVTRGEFQKFVDATGYETTVEKNGSAYALTKDGWDDTRGASWKNPEFSQTDAHPVVYVSYDDALAYIKWLNASSSESGMKFRLPTEAEWEYACRAGSATAYPWGNSCNGVEANCDGKHPCGTWTKGPYLEKTTPVGSYSPNAWGLLDMIGNVWEWCSDWYGDYPKGSVEDPTGPSSAPVRVLRGGSWRHYAGDCRSAYRDYLDPADVCSLNGFRLVYSSTK